MAASFSLRTGQRLGNGRFVLTRLLVSAPSGEVWLARDLRLEEPVALKFLPFEIRHQPAALERLRRETARCHRLTHPNIVRIYDFHEPAGEPEFVAMEYVDGPTLTVLRMERRNRVLPWEYLQPLFLQLCEALDYAHAENVIHRDLKPDNLLLDSRSRLKLANFGLAATLDEFVEGRSGADVGTLFYASPQQLQKKHPQPTDDIYSLGATLYELLTSLPPFHKGDIRKQIPEEAPQPIQRRLTDLGIENALPESVAAMILSCLAKDSEQRPQTAKALAEWVGLKIETPKAEKTAPAPTLPEAVPTEPAPRARSNANVFAAIAVTAILLIAGGAWLLRLRSSARVKPTLSLETLRAGPAWTNSLGMAFVPVLGVNGRFCIWKTRVQDYQSFVHATQRPWQKPPFEQGPSHPAVNVAWEDAKQFCDWLTQQERALNLLPTNLVYRLPSDEEWSIAVGLEHEEGSTPKEKDSKTEGVYPWGTIWPPPKGAGNYDQALQVDDFPYTSPVGAFSSNRYGLYDLGGNAREWCEDLYTPGSGRRVVRGGSWFDKPPGSLLSSRRLLTPAGRHDTRYDYFGFRCVVAPTKN